MTVNLIDFKRTNTNNAILENPSTITFTKKTYIFDESIGGNTSSNTTFDEEVRITKNNNTKIIINSDIGINVSDNQYILLCRYNSNIECTKNIEITFEYENNFYKITSVMKNKEKGEFTSIQAIAEVIK